MLDKICAYLKNYFSCGVVYGAFSIVGGAISGDGLDALQTGQYFRIIGSVFNDGIYEWPASDLHDEVFEGAVVLMAVPPEIIALSAEIETWIATNADALASPYQSESFGGYSYTKAGGYASSSDNAYGWKEQFANNLDPHKKARVDLSRR